MKCIVAGMCIGALAVSLVSAAADAPAQQTAPAPAPAAPATSAAAALGNTALLPEDPTRTLVIRTCVVCHPAELVVGKKRTVETWDRLISKMVDYGARADDDQQIALLTYFAKYFLGTDTSVGAPPPATAESPR
jgi:cytochrome c5